MRYPTHHFITNTYKSLCILVFLNTELLTVLKWWIILTLNGIEVDNRRREALGHYQVHRGRYFCIHNVIIIF